MREHIVKLYRYDELSEAAQRNAHENNRYMFDGDFDYNYRLVLDRFCETFGIVMKNYNVGYPGNYYNYTLREDVVNASEIENNPIRIAKYVHNNFYEHFTLRKRYYIPRKEFIIIDGIKYQRTKPIPKRESNFNYLSEWDECILTGEWCDAYIMRPVYDCLNYKRFFNSYRELIDDCLDSFFDAWYADREYCLSFEYFDELMCLNSDSYEFTETGEMWND